MLVYLKWCLIWLVLMNFIQLIGYLSTPTYNLTTFIVGIVISVIAAVLAWIWSVIIEFIKIKRGE